ncbi:MAG: AAA family ATPase [Desulfobacterales bacterium]|jgi:general secretion pathway protein A
MDYFSILDLHREPFSNSPDPEFFFQSGQHQSCLQRLELALRLKRGLNVVIGDVGTGKTTLCRQLIRKFSDEPEIETHLVLDPDFSTPVDLLRHVAALFENTEASGESDASRLKERIKQALFQKGVDQQKTVVLIIDEGQKIPGPCLEQLREFLNYETNEHKLLQIAIFAQPEFEKVLAARPNLADRINLKHTLGPMNFHDTRAMIRYRLRRSSDAGQREDLFTLPGLWAVYRATQGYPRKIVHLCHQCLLAVIIQNRSRAGWSLVYSCAKRSQPPGRLIGLRPALALLLVLATAGGFAAVPALQGLWAPGTPAATARPDGRQPSDRSAVPGDRPLSGTVATAAPDPANLEGTKAVDTPARQEPSLAPAAAAASPEVVQRDDTAAQNGSPPEFLGSVVLRNRETLWRLVEKVYGVFEPSYLQSVLEANPDIGSPKRVEAGAAIRVPAIPAKVAPDAGSTWWVRLGEKTSLEDAVDALRRHPRAMPPIRIVPHWHPDQGLGFSVLLRENFAEKETAEYERQRLQLSSGTEAEVFDGWPAGTVFYANPYRG